jgi:hypothetical protein
LYTARLIKTAAGEVLRIRIKAAAELNSLALCKGGGESFLEGPYKFLSELGLCAGGAETFFYKKSSPKRAVSFFKLFSLVFVLP